MNDTVLVGVVDSAGDSNDVVFPLKVDGILPPKTLENLRKLQRLNMLNGPALLSLIAQAPIDPYNVFMALQSYGPWALQDLDFTALAVLAKVKGRPVAVMQVDLISDDVTFAVLKDKQLVQLKAISGEELGKLGVQSFEAFRNRMEREVAEAINEGKRGA
jgi:hypothetical protein